MYIAWLSDDDNFIGKIENLSDVILVRDLE